MMRLFFAAVLLTVAGTAGAATFDVNDTADLDDIAPGDGVCATAIATCTLRAAITETNALAGRDQVNVPAGTYTSAATLVILEGLDLAGAGRDVVTIGPRIHVGTNNTPPVHAEVRGITTPEIRTYGHLTLRDVTVPTLATRGYFEVGGPFHSSYVRVYGSRLGSVAMSQLAVLSISDSVVENGGVGLLDSAVFVERSTFISSRISTGHMSMASRSDAVVINTTFTGPNSGIRTDNPVDHIDLNYCTFADGATLNGQGVYNLSSSIFRNGGAVANCAMSVGSSGYNISDDATCASTPTDRKNTNPLLGPLTTEAGRPVYPLLPGSPAIDTAGALVRVDERGVGRPQGGGPDVGAYESCSACAPPRRWVRGDFNVDGHSDILWRYAGNNKFAAWLMNGPTVLAGQYIENHPEVSDKAQLADIDGDGDGDIVTFFRRRLMENTAVRFRSTSFDTTFINHGHTTGDPLAVADFDGDGREDLVTRHSQTGAAIISLMAGLFAMPVTSATPPAAWELVAAKDFDGDGRGDIIWRNTQTNEVVLWKMRDWFVTGTVSLASPPPEWQFLAAGDFTGDGRADLMWRHSQTSQIALWQFDQSGALVSAAIIAQTPQPWNVRAVGKLNADDTEDLVWRQDGSGGNGDNAAWLMAPGGGILSAQYLVDVESLDWQMLGPR